MGNIILEKNNYKMIQINENKYEVFEGDKMILGLEGEFTQKQLEEQFNNCLNGFTII